MPPEFSKTDVDYNDDEKDEGHDSPMAAAVIGVALLHVYGGDDNLGV